SIGALARESVPDDFTISSPENANLFKTTLENENIPYTEKRTEVIFMKVNMENIIKSGINSSSTMTLPVVSEKDVEGVKLSEKETLLTGYNDALKGIMSFKNSGYVEIKGKHTMISQRFIGIDRKFVISTAFTKSSLPSVIVDDKVFRQLKKDIDPSIQNDSSIYIGVSLQDEDDSIKANKIFKRTEFDNNGVNLSRMEMVASQKQMMGIIMFVVGFLGLTFLITSGCILYFKQMDE
ncbi:bacitracin ABC transporter permease, partial [Priestia megaterium]|nr:bacitracin ABC transporter permease [Priestia megaterium]